MNLKIKKKQQSESVGSCRKDIFSLNIPEIFKEPCFNVKIVITVKNRDTTEYKLGKRRSDT